jgi:DNA-binding transcriptional MerR regulator
MAATLLPAEKEFYSIGEASRLTGVKPHVLRYWEASFGLIRPARRDSGQRKFTRRDLETVQRIRELLYEKRFTIEGAKKHLRHEAKKGPAQMSLELGDSAAAVEALRDVKKELSEILRALRGADFADAASL